MRSSRAAERFLVLAFLCVIAVPPIVQTVWEWSRDRHVQALELFYERPTSAHLRAYEQELEDASWLGNGVRPWVQYAQFAWFRDGGEKTLIGRDGWLFYRPGVRYATDRPTLPESQAVDQAHQAIVAFRDALAQRDIQLLVVIAPNKESVYPDMLSTQASDLESLRNPQTNLLCDRLHAAGVVVVDLGPIFCSHREVMAAENSRHLYLAQDSHWSPVGVEFAARVIADRIEVLEWLTPNRVEFAHREITANRLGDLVRMLQVPQLEHAIPAERVTCRQIVDADDKPLRIDDSNAEVLVLGDSFLRIYEQDEPGSAGFTSQLAYELRRPVAGLINDGGGTTLVRQELYRRAALLRNKRVVVWEFVERDIRYGTEGWQVIPLPPK
jgi:hypothetical protein